MSSIGKVLVALLEDTYHKRGAEVGAHGGDTAAYICNNLEGVIQYYAIDSWPREQVKGVLKRIQPHYKYKSVKAAVKNFKDVTKMYQDEIIYWNMSAPEAAKRIKRESLDWVIIKDSSKYEVVKQNLLTWTMLVRRFGMIIGNNYYKEGVKQALSEFVPSDKLTYFSNGVWYYARGTF